MELSSDAVTVLLISLFPSGIIDDLAQECKVVERDRKGVRHSGGRPTVLISFGLVTLPSDPPTLCSFPWGSAENTKYVNRKYWI